MRVPPPDPDPEPAALADLLLPTERPEPMGARRLPDLGVWAGSGTAPVEEEGWWRRLRRWADEAMPLRLRVEEPPPLVPVPCPAEPPDVCNPALVAELWREERSAGAGGSGRGRDTGKGESHAPTRGATAVAARLYRTQH